ncbi:MAG: hypothetical protein QNJ20_13620 [Paracoccaceae bacterium]|nr:hypothetical protein [Paracoccaceae bacterium]
MTVNFEDQMRAGLEVLDIDLPHELWTLIAWLEEKGQCLETPSGPTYLAIMPLTDQGSLWSHLVFESPPDMVRFWFGKDGLERAVIPFVQCGGDGSYLALWRHAGAPDRYVFLGSEGEAFVVAEDVRDFISLLTMGYTQIETRSDLSSTPDQLWHDLNDDDWPDPVELRQWVTDQFDFVHPATGAALLPYGAKDDPFAAFVAAQTT